MLPFVCRLVCRPAALSIVKERTIFTVRRFAFAGLATLALAAFGGQTFAATVIVGTCATGTRFASITDAINAVATVPGSIIKVCPGNYYEQPPAITEKLTLEGIASGNSNAVVIYPPAAGLVANTTDARGAVAAQILVENTVGPVTISNITVDGTGNNYTAGDIRGILFQDASGTVNHVVAQNQIPGGTLNGDQSGQGIMVETTNSSSASLTVENSFVQNYNKNGIVARYAGASLTATSNYVQGSGLAALAAQNGIEIAFSGATGTIKSNTVINNLYYDAAGSPGNAATDILLYDAGNGGATVTLNTLGNSQTGISVVTDTPGTYGNGATITSNKVFGTSLFDAIDIGTNSNTVTSNTIYGTAQSGVHLDASYGAGNSNTASGNTMVGSACAGYLVDSGTTGNGTPTGTFYAVPLEVTSSTASCTIPLGPTQLKTESKTESKPKP